MRLVDRLSGNICGVSLSVCVDEVTSGGHVSSCGDTGSSSWEASLFDV